VRGVGPHLVPFRLLQELLGGQRTGDPLVEYRLGTAREHLEADHHLRALGVQGGEHLQLPAMVILGVVLLAEQDHVLAGRMGDDVADAGRPGRRRAEQQPVPTGLAIGRRRRLGRRLAGGQGGDGNPGTDQQTSDGQGFESHFQHVLRSPWTRFDRQIGRSIRRSFSQP